MVRWIRVDHFPRLIITCSRFHMFNGISKSAKIVFNIFFFLWQWQCASCYLLHPSIHEVLSPQPRSIFVKSLAQNPLYILLFMIIFGANSRNKNLPLSFYLLTSYIRVGFFLTSWEVSTFASRKTYSVQLALLVFIFFGSVFSMFCWEIK